MQDWKSIVKRNERYKDFIILDKPATFREMFSNQNIPIVQLHSVQVYGYKQVQDIVGFCGVFKWEGNEFISIDGDSYAEDMTVYGYSWFTNGCNKCLDILVGDDW